MSDPQDHDSRLADMLRRYRSRSAAEREVKPFRVFHDSTLEELVEQKPRHPKQLGEIPRFGAATIGAHGAGVLRVIDEWADWRWTALLDPVDTGEDVSVFEDALGDSSWTKVLTQLYLSFSRGRPRVTSKDLVLRTGCSEETVRRVLVRMDQKGIIDRGGRGEGHMLDHRDAEDLIYALERIEGRGKSDGIGHLIEHLRVTEIVDRSSVIDDGILELLDGDPVGIHGYLDDPVEAAVWAENSLRNVLEVSHEGVVHYRYTLSNGARPDAAIRMPDGSMLCIDAKLPIGEFRNLSGDPSKKKSFLGNLKYSIRKTGETYADPDAGTASFCILYIPSEGIIHNIRELDSGIHNFAWERNVILASPTFLAILLGSIDDSGPIPSEPRDSGSWNDLRHLRTPIARRLYDEYVERYSTFKLDKELDKKSFSSLRTVWKHLVEDSKLKDLDKSVSRKASMRVSTQESERKIVSVMIEEYRSRKDSIDSLIRKAQGKDMNLMAREYSWISRAELLEKADLECSNSRFSQILGGMEERGVIERRYGSDAEGVAYVSVALRSGAQGLFGGGEQEASELAEMFDDSGNLTLLPPPSGTD